MDTQLSDYINRTLEEIKKEKAADSATTNTSDYPVWPEEQGDADHKRNPYSPV